MAFAICNIYNTRIAICDIYIYIIPELEGPPLVPCAFIHESKLTQSSCDTLKRVWTGHGEHYAACNIIQHDRFGGGSVIVL